MSWEGGGFWLKVLLVKMKIVFMRLWKKNEGKILGIKLTMLEIQSWEAYWIL